MAQNAHPEQTIRSEIEFRGVGLHSGAEVSMRLVPAPAGSGIVFRRTDLDGFEIPATGRNVAKVSYATSLMRGSVLISTTEHLLSALIGFGVDNVIVEVDNLELPILDGSALPYVEAFQSVGLKQQRRRREYLRILKEVEVREGGKFIGVYPGTGYGIDYTIDFPQPIGSARFQGDLESGDYAKADRAGADLRLQGGRAEAARYGADSRRVGGVRDYSDRQGVQNGPLRFADEFVRHKVLDLIGDLALAGRRIQGRVVAERAGHAMHTALVQRLMRDRSAWELAHVYDEVPEPAEVGVGAARWRRLLPSMRSASVRRRA